MLNFEYVTYEDKNPYLNQCFVVKEELLMKAQIETKSNYYVNIK